MNAKQVQKELTLVADPTKAQIAMRFFKTGKGEYGEGDQFLGVIVPEQRKIAKTYKELPLKEIDLLLQSRIHEHRLTALLILVDQFKRANEMHKKQIFDFYIKRTSHINNWDLVDSSAPHIVGIYLLDKPRELLYTFARSRSLWKKRIAIISTLAFIRNGDYNDTFALAELLLHDTHDLIHKAVGWMLREVGKKDRNAEEQFLKKHYTTMPRTMLRYAIEHFDKKKRDFYLGRSV